MKLSGELARIARDVKEEAKKAEQERERRAQLELRASLDAVKAAMTIQAEVLLATQKKIAEEMGKHRDYDFVIERDGDGLIKAIHAVQKKKEGSNV